MRIKVTNRLGLPNAFVKAIEADPYDPDDGGKHSDYTITGLLKPARMVKLAKDNVIVEDASDRLFSLQGQIIHGILERSKEDLESEGYIVEKRFYKTYTVNGREFVVSAKVDVFDPVAGRLSDYKYTSVASAKKGLKDEHKWQVNFQAELLRLAGFKVSFADATILMRDWSAERTYSGYPSSPAMVHNVPIFSTEEIDAFVIERIRAQEEAKNSLPKCTDEERWKRDKWAIVRLTSGVAFPNCGDFKSEKEAIDYLKYKGLNGRIEYRKGSPVRCLRYCPVRSVCTQARDTLTLEENSKCALRSVDEDGFTKV